MASLTEGDRIAQRYIVKGRLGSGGMATVYECVDSMLGLPVAVKLLHDHLLADSEEFVERFRREAEVMSHLSHPASHSNIVAVRDVIERDDSMAIVMEVVEAGRSLAELIEERGHISERQAISLLSSTLAGMQFIHEHNIIHRDIKPSNILLSRDASGALVPKISDFGIAKWLDRPDHLPLQSNLTQTKSMFGSPAYMAPELFDSAAAASEASDLYALGVVLYELLVGEPPFIVDSMPSHVMRVSTQRAPSPRLARPELSGDIERIIAVALAKDAPDRFPSAESFKAALEGRGIDVSAEMSVVVPDVDPVRFGRDYRVVRRIGRGPIATVFACRDESLDVPVVVKMLRGNDPTRRERFLAEARGQAALHQGRTHRNIAAIRHIINQDEITALVVEHVEGLPLDRYVNEARPDLAGVLRLMGEAADALKRAHALDIVHRNLKPSNLLVTWTGGEAAASRRSRAKVCDFCMDTVTTSTRLEAARKTRTVAYLAPEVQRGRQPDAASDVYSLGVMMLEALSGRLPGGGLEGNEGAEAMREAIPQVSSGLRTLLTDMLANDPTDRPDMAGVFDGVNEALRGLTGEGLQSAIPAAEMLDLGDAPEVAQRSSTGLIVAAALVVIAVAGVVAYVATSGNDSSPSGQEPPATAASTPDVVEAPDLEPVDTAPPEPPEPAFDDVSDEVARFLSDKAAEVTACLQAAFEHERVAELESASGSLEVEIDVSAEGQVTEVRTVQDSLAIIEFGPCMSAKIETWSFPASRRKETWAKTWFF